MAKSISCADVGADCKWSATAQTEDELMKKVEEHVKEDHKDLEMTSEAVAHVKSHIKES